MKKQRPYVLTIAGFDPSGGAGILADIKTLEQIKCYGLAVCTANTIQNAHSVTACYWTPIAQIKAQLQLILTSYDIRVIKIGVVENWDVLLELITLIRTIKEEIKIIVDPILQSSSGFDFHMTDTATLDTILETIFLITPNYLEMQQLYGRDIDDALSRLTAKTHVLLKGGHHPDVLGRDMLYLKNDTHFQLNPKGTVFFEKHGSGCILSAAIAGYLALGFPILKACYRAKRYTEHRLRSNKTLLAYHD